MNKQIRKLKISRPFAIIVLLSIILEIGVPSSVFRGGRNTSTDKQNTATIADYSIGGRFSDTVLSLPHYVSSIYAEKKYGRYSHHDTHYLGRRAIRTMAAGRRHGIGGASNGFALTAKYQPPNHEIFAPGFSLTVSDDPITALDNLRTIVLLN